MTGVWWATSQTAESACACGGRDRYEGCAGESVGKLRVVGLCGGLCIVVGVVQAVLR